MSDEQPSVQRSSDAGGIGAVPGLVRVGAEMWWHTTGWALGSTLRASRRLARAATSADSASHLADDIQDAAKSALRNLIDVADIEERVGNAGAAGDMAKRVMNVVPTPSASATMSTQPPGAAVELKTKGSARPRSRQQDVRNGADGVPRSLPDRGKLLLYKSRDVRYEEDAHPAYELLVESLAPDEARILRLMLLKGPQPAVDVRTGGPIGLISSRLIAPGLSMIGARAGLRYVERVPAYLQNLNRLGLIWFSRETLHDPQRYQVLEAQPDVLDAMHSVRQAKIVRRSIHLTPFGEGFCRAALAPEEIGPEDLPEHAAPAKAREPQPPAPAPE